MTKHIKIAAEKRREDAPQGWVVKGRDGAIRSAQTLREETTRIRADLWSQVLGDQPESREEPKR